MSRPVAALMYDFDKTLCTKDMQEYGFLPALGMSPAQFWAEVTELIDTQEMDNVLGYMYMMVEKAREKNVPITRDTFREQGAQVEFFPGVPDWFDRIDAYGASIGLDIEHYIVSSGIKEIIEGTPIAEKFKKIYACEFMYDREGQIKWPKFAINYTAKTQFLFRINKGVLRVDSRSGEELNRVTPENERRIPFQNMVYIGDGLTDVPCMKLVKSHGGQSIAVYDPRNGKSVAKGLLEGSRVNFVSIADYREGSELDVTVKSILNNIQAVEEMQRYQA